LFRIPDDIIQAVRQSSNLIEVAQEYLQLLRQGNTYVACCFRNHGPSDDYPIADDTPSLTFHQGQDGEWRYYCYGCGLGKNETEQDKGPSDVFKFVQQYHRYAHNHHLDFPTVLRMLGERAGISVPPPTPPDPRIEHLKEQKTQRNRDLWKNLIGDQGALDFLMQERGLTMPDINNPAFRLGLASKTDPYENCRDRIAFGVCEVTNSATAARTVGFQYRVRPGVQCGGEAKYVVDYETDIWKKSHHLYLLHAAVPAIRREKFAHIVEGQFDGIWMHKCGFENTVVAMGTDLSAEQRTLLSRYTKRLVYWVEDAAGAKRIQKILPPLMSEGFEVMVIVTGGKDPDEICRKYGPAGIEMYVATQKKPAIQYALEGAKSQYDAVVSQAKAKALRELIPTLQAIKDPTVRLIYYSEVARDYGVDMDQLRESTSTPVVAPSPPMAISLASVRPVIRVGA
jgi:DNA primase